MDHSLLMDYDAVSAEPKFFDDYHNKKKQLEALMQHWEALQLALDT